MADCGCRAHGSFLTSKGLEEAAQRRSLEGLAPRGEVEYVDTMGSVSGLRRDEDLYEMQSDEQLLEQCERFHHGS